MDNHALSPPISAEHHFNLGAVYYYRGDTESALAEVETLKKLKSKRAKRLATLIETGK